jgi:hypothetical protein
MNEVISLIGSIPKIKDIILVDSEDIIFTHGVKYTMRVPRGNDKDYNSSIQSIVEQHGGGSSSCSA